jgi:hypothetical protein
MDAGAISESDKEGKGGKKRIDNQRINEICSEQLFEYMSSNRLESVFAEEVVVVPLYRKKI